MFLYLQLGISGAITGCFYALLAIGIVLLFRTVRVLNLAHGAIATLSVYVFIQLTSNHRLGYWPAFFVAVLLAALVGVVIDRGVMARIAGRSLLAKIIATLGILIALNAVIGLVWGFNVRTVSSGLPQGSFPIGHLRITYEELIVAAISIAIGLAIWWMLRRTYVGIAMRALSQSTDVAQLLGVNVRRISMATWALGTALAGAAGILLAPFITLEPVRLTEFLPQALAAALVGRLVSLPGAFVGGVLLGVLENYVPIWFNVPGVVDMVAFFAIVALLVVRRPTLSLREQEAQIS